MNDVKIKIKMEDVYSDTAYIALPGYPDPVRSGVVAKTIPMETLIANFHGPRVNFDFNEEGLLIGIEILVYDK